MVDTSGRSGTKWMLVGLILGCAGERLSAGVNTWTPSGPGGGSIVNLAVGENPGVLYANGRNGLFRSLDGGSSWANLGRGLGTVSVGEATPDLWRPATVWLATSGGAYRSDDYGRSWAVRNTGLLNPAVSRIVVDPIDSERLWAVTPTRIFVSIDQGASWQGSVGGPAGTFDFEADRNVRGRAWAASNGGATRVWRTDDGGFSWRPAEEGLPSGFVTAVTVDPANSARVLVAFAAGSLYRSNDAGDSWQHVREFEDPLLSMDMRDSTLVVATLNEIWRSGDAGASFTSLGEPGKEIQGVTVAAGRVWASSLGGLFVRDLLGGSWSQAPIPAQAVTSLAVAADREAIYLATFPAVDSLPGIYRRGPQGWDDISQAFVLPFGIATAAAPGTQEDALVAVLTGQGNEVLRAVGAEWQNAGSGLDPVAINELEIDADQPNIRWAALSTGVFRSTDGGATWQARSSGLPSECCPVIEVDLEQRPGGMVYAVVQREGVFRSLDQGLSWHPARSGLDLDTLTLALDAQRPGVGYAGSASGGLYRTEDGGVSWQLTGSLGVPIVALQVDPRPGRPDVYAATLGRGAWHSADDGDSWAELAEGLEWGALTELEVESRDGVLTLHAGSVGAGLFSYTVADGASLPPVGFTWSPAQPRPGELVRFEAAGGASSVGARTTWTFDDGSTGQGAVVSHQFAGSGDFDVRLHVAVGDRASQVEQRVEVRGGPLPPCQPDPTTLCVQGDRFEVTVAWKDFSGGSGVGTIVTSSADSGLFWFFDAANWELLVKVLDGCALNGRYWVFSAATTNVEYTLRVVDTETGDEWVSSNASGTSAPAVTDTNAFSTCQ